MIVDEDPGEPSYTTRYRQVSTILIQELGALGDFYTELFGDEAWIKETTAKEMADALEVAFTQQDAVDADVVLAVKPQGITKEQVLAFVERVNNTIDYEAKQNTSTQNGNGAFISGEGNNFTIFFNTNGKDGNATYKMALVLSGTKTSAGIRNLEYAFVMLEKNDPDNEKMDVGTYRIVKDGDGISEPTTWSSNAPTLELDVEDLLFDISK